mmetsp:Transcript_50834/g.99657  ORF Transcript_50834/g.99657 Transcript_50834/m.99657 type:complete len:347 (-) Transcript_50834:257-1297(-)|eukprot:CAMPEP_0175130162 /NCGR_PEP_ID=MMETSP0087-20121206/5861_1 /TAXON_ID=136419 /ORGANISM="Unknown Unknown, Strain D1" /LENGTH=346 /DNA_ID=CAMNT_0016412365 /DNA_START=15 /DNA_END=1055 /DNA_ORIENTATION=+
MEGNEAAVRRFLLKNVPGIGSGAQEQEDDDYFDEAVKYIALVCQTSSNCEALQETLEGFFPVVESMPGLAQKLIIAVAEADRERLASVSHTFSRAEILFQCQHVFFQFCDTQTLCSCACICKFWQQKADDSKIWQRLLNFEVCAAKNDFLEKTYGSEQLAQSSLAQWKPRIIQLAMQNLRVRFGFDDIVQDQVQSTTPDWSTVLATRFRGVKWSWSRFHQNCSDSKHGVMVTRCWAAYFQSTFLCWCDTAKDAAIKVDNEAIRRFGQKALLNFPKMHGLFVATGLYTRVESSGVGVPLGLGELDDYRNSNIGKADAVRDKQRETKQQASSRPKKDFKRQLQARSKR